MSEEIVAPARKRKPGGGRKPKEGALTPAERAARYRERQKQRKAELELAALTAPVVITGVGSLFDVDAALLEQALQAEDPKLLTLAATSVLDGHRKAKLR